MYTEDSSAWTLCRGRIKASRIVNSHQYCIFSRKKFQFNKFVQHIVSHTEAVPKQGQQARRILLLLVPEGSLACHKASHNERLTASIASNNLRITIICDHSKLPEYSIFLTIVKNSISFANLSKLLPRISKVLCFPQLSLPVCMSTHSCVILIIAAKPSRCLESLGEVLNWVIFSSL